MSMPWFRMYAEFATDAKVQSMSEAMQRRLTMILCLRCSDVTVTLCDEELAFQLRISMDELAETKALFLRKGFIENDWSVCNWEKRQYASDSSAARTRSYRDRKKNVTVTSHVTKSDSLDTDTDTDTKQEQRAGARPTKKRGTRLPADWSPDVELAAWVDTEKPGFPMTSELAKFRDYWVAKAGAGGVKLDWSATFRNWVRNANTGNAHANIQQGRKLSAVEQVEQAIRNRRQREADNEDGAIAALGYGRTVDEDGEPLRAHMG